MIETPAGLIRPTVSLAGVGGGDTASLIATVSTALREAGNLTEVVEAFVTEAGSNGYNHALMACMAYAECV